LIQEEIRRLEVDTRRKGIETWVKKLIFGAMPTQVKHATLAEKISIKPYTRNDVLHMM
jgi:hypothetical protein